MSKKLIFTVQQIADRVGGEIVGDPQQALAGVQQIEAATSEHLTFIGNEKYARLWPTSRAAAALVSLKMKEEVLPREAATLIFVKNADLAMATVLGMFAPPLPVGGMTAALASDDANDSATATFIHPTAVVDPTARLGSGVRIGAHCVIGPSVTIGERTVIYPNVTVLDETIIGKDGLIWPGVVIRERTTIGDRCIIHSSVNIGSDGFGYRPSEDGKGLTKIPQIGTVIIGHDVEIGAGSCIDRGKFAATILGDGCKLDNMVQIAHNCILGKCVIVAGQAGVAGSTTLEDGVIIGGRAGVGDHIHIAAGGVVMAASGVMRDVEANQRVSGIPARDSKQFFREQAALGKLPDLIKKQRRDEANREK